MIYEGQQLSNPQTVCLVCGNATWNRFPNMSAFTRYCCANEGCEARVVVVTIEKCSNVIFSVFPQFVIEGKPAWANMKEFVDVDGKPIIPTPRPEQIRSDR